MNERREETEMKVDINEVYGQSGMPLPSIHTDYAEGLPMGDSTGCTPLNPYVVSLDGYQREILENQYENSRWMLDEVMRRARDAHLGIHGPIEYSDHTTLIHHLEESP